MKKILFFYPENPLLKHQGNNARAFCLLEYFKAQNYQVDLVSLEQPHKENFTNAHLATLKNKHLITNGWLLKRSKRSGIKYSIFSLKQKISNLFKNKVSAFNRIRFGQGEELASITKDKTYDIIIISYAYYHGFLKYLNTTNSKTIVDTHDFLTSQFQNHKQFNLGVYFNNEIQLLNDFDNVWAISSEEHYLYSQFLGDKVKLAPHVLEDKSSDNTQEKSIDLIYVASDNNHNVKAADWFFNNVYPLLNKDITITVVGKISQVIPDFTNVTKHTYVEDLSDLYQASKVSICPMITGTGLKIKVVEALSYALPVVCNERGLDGLLNKTNNGCMVTNSETEFARFIDQLLTDKKMYDKQSQLAADFFKQSFSKQSVYTKLNASLK
ncbi:glycosyltransferase [Olleya sp. HaHaR_3_96]|uniref:glycosyltransferase n=1 Tax=Olleya sp. HaHaR_3_96 TaxID=2745560 RepID=UPI001C4F56FA|nr:glycosyltransferase [Olleya sp. HaHaR_3_96]QXP61499.1 glycosyltransferase family 4 protein [Olleya sp. HaHaR_3_96]